MSQTDLSTHRAARFSPTVSLALLSSLVVTFLAASSAPTPLYAVYQAEWAFGPLTTTVVFGVYAIAVLVALLTFGRLSDHVGRRPVLLTAIAMQAIAMVVFVEATGVAELFVSRIVQGLATGAAVGAVGAALLDVDRRRGTLLNSVAPPVGTGAGALLSGLLVQYLPAPTTLVYVVLLVLFALQAVGIFLLDETVSREPGALRSLRPEVVVPRHLRREVLTAIPVLLAVWALAGFYGSLSPAIVADVVGHPSFVLGGLAFFVLAASGAVGVWLTRDAAPARVMLLGISTLVTGVVIGLASVEAGSAVGFFAGSVVAGIGFGAGFQGGLRTVVPLALPHERAGVLSVLYVVSYFGMGVPAVAAGWAVGHGVGLVPTALGYGAAIIGLALVALAGLVAPRRPEGARSSEPAMASCPEAA